MPAVSLDKIEDSLFHAKLRCNVFGDLFRRYRLTLYGLRGLQFVLRGTVFRGMGDDDAPIDAASVVGLLAAGLLSLSIASAWAFTRDNVSPDGGNYSFTDPDQKLTDPGNRNSDQGAKPFGSTGPVVQFGVQQGPLTGRSNSASAPDPYFRSLQMGN